MNFLKKRLYSFAEYLWDFWCLISVVGIWPRFIEPRLLDTSRITCPIRQLPEALHGFKIVQISDLHFHEGVPQKFLEKIVKRVNSLVPDMIVFTGDLLCYSTLKDEERLENFLKRLQAPYGCYFVPGNHDYERYVSLTNEGYYDVKIVQKSSFIVEGFRKLFSQRKQAKGVGTEALKTGHHKALLRLLRRSRFEFLENKTKKVHVGNSFLNVCGLGDYWLGRSLPDQAFSAYDDAYPGIILSHNPDTVELLQNYPGEMILSGHTHGAQVNLPWLRTKFIYLENMENIRGLRRVGNKNLYVNRGLGSHRPFRWFAMPEVLVLTLEEEK